MTKRDWSRNSDRQRIARQGAESVGKPRAGAHKEADAAEIVTKILRCPCGHRGKVELPLEMLVDRKFKCSRCGRRVG
ncbi:hypothetical protein EFV37_13210 [Mesorhizobium loti]|uniref:Uncharacterized protein n=1 Tax=Mesorhizobium jarvisii TaxID=1777867 RepID=A0A6M7TH64_9HYPH|nr:MULTISPECIES: hypothetical protein [Mesorhizobium]OBQ58041.1 hypothetical protein A9K72_27950 [Mesorhizobium loti]QKC63153.1 hypothetical protein EB229_13200 [Mesorhizobium jarvisii]QKD09064.1 hypothetical protein EFV37_13210 [Mesorhizobium loti]RJT30160.1 hypothetical protein D3242_25935 [Mesorhizobium jarvisii]